MRRTALLVPALALLALSTTAPALASWDVRGTGSTEARADALAPPAALAATPVAPTSSAVDVTFTAAPGPVGTTFVVQRDKTATGLPGPVTLACTASPCHDTGLTSGVTYTYSVTATLGGWRTTPVTATATTTGVLTLDAALVTGGGKTRFSGTATTAGVTVDVALCRTATPVCTTTTPGYVESVSVTPATLGAWTTGPTTSRLVPGTTYWATAAQGPALSAPLVFTA
jgi:hypothetical protein